MCEPPSHPSRSAPRAGGSLRSTTGPDKRAAREGRARASATSGSPVGTRTYLSNVNVPFSQPSGDRVQKVGRKVRSRDEGTLTLGPAARSARPAPRRNQSSRRGLRLLRTGIVRRACWSPMRWRRRWFAVARLRTATGPKFGQLYYRDPASGRGGPAAANRLASASSMYKKLNYAPRNSGARLTGRRSE